MSCCGKGRAELARGGVRAGRFVPSVPPRRDDPEDTHLRYRGPIPMVLRGPVSRRLYRIEAAGPVAVAAGDVPALVRTGWFDRR
jgi:hypothetical protein